MKDLEVLLHSIDKANAEDILGQPNLVTQLNFLCQHALIEISEENIQLTQKGKDAKINGILDVVSNVPSGESGKQPAVQMTGENRKIFKIILTLKKSFFKRL